MAAPQVIVATLTPDEWEVANRPVVTKRAGGHQRLLFKILQRANHAERRVTLYPQDVERITRYAHHNEEKGGGGYQDRFWALLAAVRRATR